jgi:transcriptional regulator with XRE-family HTH domain
VKIPPVIWQVSIMRLHSKLMREYTEERIRRLFGQNLKRLRMRKKVSQLDLASRIEVSHNFINEIENGHKWVSSKTISLLANVLKVEPHFFFISDMSESMDTEILDVYLDDISGSFSKMVNDLRETYLHRPDGED